MIGFETSSEQGPGIFLTRLRDALERRGQFSDTEPDVWVQLSFHALPDWIRERKARGKTKVLVRMDGAYCGRHHKIRKPAVLSIPFLDDWYSARVNRKKNRLIRENLLAADGIVFQSEFSRDVTWRFVTKTPPGVIVYNGIDLQAFSTEGLCSDIRLENTVNILVSHSFRPYHRLHDSFRILSHLVKNNRQAFHLHILGHDEENLPAPATLLKGTGTSVENAGSGSIAGNSSKESSKAVQGNSASEGGKSVRVGGQSTARKLGVSFPYARQVADSLGLREGLHYTFHGKKPHRELASVYRACDLMLNLSYWDTCPNVVIEAMACGLPVVGVNYGGVAELVGATGGLLVDEPIPFTWLDHQDFDRMPKAPIQPYADAILNLAQNLPHASQRARALAEKRFDIEKVAEEYILAAHKIKEVETVKSGWVMGTR